MAAQTEEKEINILDYLKVINKYRGLIIGIFFFVTISTLIFSLLSPKIYKSEVTILPIIGDERTLVLSSGVEQPMMAAVRGDLLITQSSEIFKAILQSNTMYDAIIERFNLKQIYKCKYWFEARKNLANNTKITIKKGIINIAVEDKDKYLAKAICDFYIQKLNELNNKLITTQAKSKRLFIEERLITVIDELRKAEEALVNFQKKQKIIQIDEQMQTAIKKTAELETELAKAEIELKVIQNYSTAETPEVINLKTKIRELKKEIRHIKYGGNPDDRVSMPSFIKAPTVALAYVRLLREENIKEEVYKLLINEYERARIDEHHNTPILQVIDAPQVAERKCKPKIKLNVMIAGCLALFISIFLAFLLEYLRKVKNEYK